jgi:ABC-2 type transport system permease protein
MIEVTDLIKRYGDKLAVDHLSFRVEPGRVAGFLGPNGAGKSTTMRHTAGAISAVIGIVFVLPIVTSLLPGSWGQHIHDYLPPAAGAMIAQARQGVDQVLSPWQGFGVFCAWTVVLLAAALYALKRRDA